VPMMSLFMTPIGKLSTEMKLITATVRRSNNQDKGIPLRKARESNPNATIVFIGDGVSDIPAAVEADVLFAKMGKDLVYTPNSKEKYCTQHGIKHTKWEDFSEVLKHVQALQ
jgi:2-hydroxy-3-keto-5-methylthiopentenyl-1-phosphate phosphatase